MKAAPRGSSAPSFALQTPNRRRSVIDELDEEIIQNLSLRMDIAERIGEYKKANNVTILQITRWEDVINKRLNLGTAMGLSEDFMGILLQLIHKESIRRQAEVMNIKSSELITQ